LLFQVNQPSEKGIMKSGKSKQNVHRGSCLGAVFSRISGSSSRNTVEQVKPHLLHELMGLREIT
jgi:hypothetical protein